MRFELLKFEWLDVLQNGILYFNSLILYASLQSICEIAGST